MCYHESYFSINQALKLYYQVSSVSFLGLFLKATAPLNTGLERTMNLNRTHVIWLDKVELLQQVRPLQAAVLSALDSLETQSQKTKGRSFQQKQRIHKHTYLLDKHQILHTNLRNLKLMLSLKLSWPIATCCSFLMTIQSHQSSHCKTVNKFIF